MLNILYLTTLRVCITLIKGFEIKYLYIVSKNSITVSTNWCYLDFCNSSFLIEMSEKLLGSRGQVRAEIEGVRNALNSEISDGG